MRRASIVLIPVVICGVACSAAARPKEVIDPAEAAADPDFAVQGEYVGTGAWPGSEKQEKIAAQVIARGEGKFEICLLRGGLPGEGWKRGGDRIRLEGARDGNLTTLKGPDGLAGKIAAGKLTLSAGGKQTISLERTERKSPTLEAKPPKGAVILFDGTTADNFDHGQLTQFKTLMSGTTSKAGFASYTLHLEFRLSWMPTARGQARSNSGVYMHDCYEVQVLDSFGLEGRHNECGGLYIKKDPDVNMCLPPMVWQTYDIDFTAPKYDAAGKKVTNARMSVRHNGVTIHKDVEYQSKGYGRQDEGPAPRPIHLQGHGNHVQYRNIWLVEKK